MITATVHDLIESELTAAGYDEFMTDGQITFLNKSTSVTHKILTYDEDVHAVVTDAFFQGFTFTDPMDKPFKKMFVNRFWNREINRQTLEDFSNKLLYVTLSRQHYIETVFADLLAYVNNESTTTGNGDSFNETIHTGNQIQISDSRQLESDLPQDNINLNVDNTTLNYGNRNSISRNKNQNDSDSTNTVTATNGNETITSVKNLEKLIQSEKIWDEIFNIYDKACFLQTW